MPGERISSPKVLSVEKISYCFAGTITNESLKSETETTYCVFVLFSPDHKRTKTSWWAFATFRTNIASFNPHPAAFPLRDSGRQDICAQVLKTGKQD